MKINIDNYELYFLRYIERRLSDEERKEVDAFLLQHPELKEVFDMYDPFLTLTKDEDLVFDDKDSLMRSKSPFVMSLWVRYASVAAAVLLVFSVGLSWMQREQPSQNVILADNTIDIIEEKYIPMISDSTIDDERVKEVISTTKNVIRHETQNEATSMLAQAEEKPVIPEQQPVEAEPEQIYTDTTIYIYDNSDEDVYYAMDMNESVLVIDEQYDDNTVYMEEYSDALIAYNVGRAAENINYDSDTIYYYDEETAAAEPMPILSQFKEMFTTLFRNKKDKVESELMEYADYVKVAYHEKKEEITMYIADRVEKIF